MKKILILFLLLPFSLNLLSQVPHLFKYQALVRNSEGAILVNHTVNIRTSILSTSFDGTTVYSETHIKNTNSFGLVTLDIGGGALEFGLFSEIDWGSSIYFLKIEVDETGGNEFELMGVSQLLAVPYALYAEKTGEINRDNDSENELQDLSYSSGNLSLSKGNTVFVDVNDADHDLSNELITRIDLTGSVLAVEEAGVLRTIDLSNLAGLQSLSYNSETKMLNLTNGGEVDLSGLYNDEDSVSTNELISSLILDGLNLKITEGGILKVLDLSYLADDQVLVYDEATKVLKIDGGNQVDLSNLLNDSDSDPTNEVQNLSVNGSQVSISGGNTINIEGALALTDLDNDTQLVVEESQDDDVIRFYTNGEEVLRIGKEASLEFLSSNTPIGYSAGKILTTGSQNVLLGYFAGNKLNTGSLNTFVGALSGGGTENSTLNTFVGFNSGSTNLSGSNNAFFAANSGSSNTIGQYNTFIGAESGSLNTTGNNNVFVGYHSGNGNETASGNSFVGVASGFKNKGLSNSFFGNEAGYNSTGNYNTFIGTESGFSNLSASKNTFLGYLSGFSNTTGDENLYLGSESGYSSTTPSGNTFIGTKSGFSNVLGLFNTYIGYQSGAENTSSSNTFIGYESGLNNKGSENLFLGKMTAELNSNGSENIYIGNYTAQNNGGNENVSIGLNSLKLASEASQNTYLGYASAYNSIGSGNVFLGYKSGYNELSSNRLYVENSISSNPLIYGEFDNDILIFNAKVGVNTNPLEALSVNGAVQIGNTFSENTGAIRFDGVNFEGFNGVEWLRMDLQKIPEMSDLSAMTRITVEAISEDNKIRFFTKNEERLSITDSGTFEIKGKNFFMGETSGMKNTLGDENIFMGYYSGSESVSASGNLALGHWAGGNITEATQNVILGNLSAYNTSLGSKNTFLGFASAYTNISGSSNVFIGYEAGYNEAGSNKLYIQNSRLENPLIYGDFSSKELILNANVSIGNSLALEKLEVDGAIKISNTITENEGTIRWDGTHFEGYTGVGWKVFDYQFFDLIRNDLNDTKLSIDTLLGESFFNYTIKNTSVLKISKSTINLIGNDVFIGEESGLSKNTADKNTFIGYWSGKNTNSGSNNVFLGYQSGLTNSSGSENTFLGYRSGNKNTLGLRNTFLGSQSGHEMLEGQDNVFLGVNAGYFSALQSENVYIGSFSAYQNQGSQNVFLGMNTGRNNLLGSGNVFLGHSAGMDETSSNKLYISNSSTAEPLIYGDFETKEIRVNNKLSIKEVLHLNPLSTAPLNPEVGDIYMGTDDKLYIYISTNEWKALAFQ